MSFSAEWLALREPADHRARDQGLAQLLAKTLSEKDEPFILDLGCGSGSNLRALAPLLGRKQNWTLVDYDPALLVAARDALKAWADRVMEDDHALSIEKNNCKLRIAFQQADLSRGLVPLLAAKPDCVTASALFDLCSPDFIGAAVRDIAHHGAIFYTVLTYDGLETWSPPHDADDSILAAFIAHQKTDKGFGVSAGPDATRALAEHFQRAGYEVHEASTPWILEEPGDRTLIAELASGIGEAAQQTGRVSADDARAWIFARQNARRASIGHRDLLALPPTS